METTIHLENTARLMGCDATHCWHPFRQEATDEPPLPVVGAKGAEIYLADGTTMIDAISSWWVNLHGHKHPAITGAVADQLNTFAHVMFADYTHEPAVRLAEMLSGLLPGNPQRIYYSDNGSTAVESALKIALQYWHNRGEPRRRIIAFRHGYHGETFGSMALSSRSLFSHPFSEHLFEVDFIDPPVEGNDSLQQLQCLLETDEVACMIFEPLLQGVGGMKVHSLEGLSSLIACCRAYGVLTIADEVLTGGGRTGPYFASERLSETPDMFCLAKQLTGGLLPLGVTACTEEIFEAFIDERRDRALLHGHSYCGNALGCRAALASLDLLTTDACDIKRQQIRDSHLATIHRWQNSPEVIRVEVIGTILVVELADRHGQGYFSSVRSQIARTMFEMGVHIRPFGNVLHILPPYCITGRQLQQCYAALDAAVAIAERS